MIGALAVGSTKARLAGYDNFVILNHHEEPHGFFLNLLDLSEQPPRFVFHMLTARQEFETTICCAMSEIEASRRLRIFLANRVLALGWALKGACKPCAHRLFATARWLVPEAQRFLLQRISAKNRNQLLFEWLLSRIHPRIVAGLLIGLAFWGALNFALRTTATETAPLVDSSAYPQKSQASPEGNIVSISKSSPTQDSALETGSISAAQIAPVPLPVRKPARISKVATGKGGKANLTNQKRMAQRDTALPKPKLLLPSYPHKRERSVH